MSQTSFLETVVSWDQEQCRQHVEEALPRLISFYNEAQTIQENIGILKTMCLSFVPCLELPNLEKKVFSHITKQSCEIYDRILLNLRELTNQVGDGKSQPQQEISNLLLNLLEIIECYVVCIQHIQMGDNSVDISYIHSLPYCAIYMLKGTYQHCKALLSLLDRVTADSGASDQDVDDLCFVCHGLFEVCQVVAELDVKLVVTFWKAITRFASQHKSLIKERLELGRMLVFICSEVETSLKYLFQLAPPETDDGDQMFSQGDEKTFQKSVKVLGFQMKIIIKLVQDFIDYLSDCEEQLFQLLIFIQKNMPPSLSAPKISATHVEEIRRQLCTAMEPLLMVLVTNRRFRELWTQDRKQNTNGTESPDGSEEKSLPHLLILLQVLNCLPAQPGHTELSLPVYMPGLMTRGKAQRSVSLYEHICICVCGFIGSFPAKHFGRLEEVLLENVISKNPYCSLLATDAWCFVSRYGTADLCYNHVSFLLTLCTEVQSFHCLEFHNVLRLIRRLIKFLAAEHQTELYKKFPPKEHLTLWSDIHLGIFSQSLTRQIVEDSMSQSLKDLHNFVNMSEKKVEDIYELVRALRCLKNLYSIQEVVDKFVPSSMQMATIEKLQLLWLQITDLDPAISSLLEICIAQMLELFARLLRSLQNTDILKVVGHHLHTCSDAVKLSVIDFLRQCGTIRFAPSPEQPQILRKITVVFSALLSDKNSLILQSALKAFTAFAEETAHESVVPECMQLQPGLQDTVVAFLSKMVYPSLSVSEVDYLKQQAENMILTVMQRSVELQERVIENASTGTDTEQPSSKRKRTEHNEQPSQYDKIVSSLETSLKLLKSLKEITPLPGRIVEQLQSVQKTIEDIVKDSQIQH
ncbi:hypothetical protein CHS0354_022985 [Potamilus streckersoni]|uniref:Uncharacterized protein n=1 Tax=Potamilus streckersoni TaxID=2493646 RepID=A0AAE0VSL7_9BIVA|nr:hypothetical protein CHS0354_022985 [Potamilus streckersoni]